MKVKELREALANAPDDFDVILSRDAEGNGFSPLADAEPCKYIAETTWSGQVPHPDDQQGPNDAILLMPVN